MRSIVALALLPGCYLLRSPDRQYETTRGVAVAGVVTGDGDFEGGAITTRGGTGGMEATFEVGGSRRGRDDDMRLFRGGDVAAGLRVSPLGLVGNNARFARYFDFGAQAGLGGGIIGGPGRVTTFGSAWAGGWFEIGMPGTTRRGSHLRLVFDARREALTSPYLDGSRFLLGVSWAGRRAANDKDWVHFFD